MLMLRGDEPANCVRSALLASVFLSPQSHGLTYEEIHEVAKRAGFKRGEIDDAIAHIQVDHVDGRMALNKNSGFVDVSDFNQRCDPEYRDWKAFEAVRQTLIELGREVGKDKAKLPRDVLVERVAAQGIDRKKAEVAVAMLLIDGILTMDKQGLLCDRSNYALPSVQIAQQSQLGGRIPATEFKSLKTVYSSVEDVIKRRDDGRAPAASALDAFESTLDRLQQTRFRSWWVHTRSELNRAAPMHQPTTVTVLATALAEAALTFVVPEAQKAGLMKRIEGKTTGWRFSDLIKGAKSGDPSVVPIFDERTAQRALDLNDARQRIHAGFLIDSVPTGPIPDLRPEQATDAKQTAEIVVRRVIDWLSTRTATPTT